MSGSAIRTVTCPLCHGIGRHFASGNERCPLCDGERVVADNFSHFPVCAFCYGVGTIGYKLCHDCGGCGHRKPNPVKVTPPETFEARRNALLSQLEVTVPIKSPKKEDDGPIVVRIEAGKPVTAHLSVAKILAPLTGVVFSVCDPYYGTGMLARLHGLSAAKSVRVLTKTADSGEASFLPKRIQEFVTEFSQFEFRRHAGKDLHDRYIVTAEELILLGHGLKDIGGKESFVVRLDRRLAGDMIDDVQQSFDAKWSAATPL